ncbi:MAG: DNA circulation protein, partial [Planctomycetota bacterium]
RSMMELRNNLFRYLNQAAGSLPQVIEYTVPPAVVSSLVLAYDMYEDLDREQEILDRNRNIHHPGFLPAGEVLEILSE